MLAGLAALARLAADRYYVRRLSINLAPGVGHWRAVMLRLDPCRGLLAALLVLPLAGCANGPRPPAALAARRPLDQAWDQLAADTELASHDVPALDGSLPAPVPRFQQAIADRLGSPGHKSVRDEDLPVYALPLPENFAVGNALSKFFDDLKEPFVGPQAEKPDDGPVKPPPSLPQLVTLTTRQPSNDRNWIPEHKILAHAEFDRDQVTIHNVRNAEFFTYRDCIVKHYDKTYDLSKIRSVDFVVVPFSEIKAVAHTLLSFGFEGGEHVGISVEVRLEQGEGYDPALGAFGQFELIYVIADERDLIPVRVEHRDVDVYVYRSTAPPEMARKLFVDMLKRANQLYEHPEFYDTLGNNCTTNIVRHINAIAPGKVPYDFRVLLPGYADKLAYDLGLIDNRLPFEEVKRRARVNEAVIKYKDHPQFSAKIRGEASGR